LFTRGNTSHTDQNNSKVHCPTDIFLPWFEYQHARDLLLVFSFKRTLSKAPSAPHALPTAEAAGPPGTPSSAGGPAMWAFGSLCHRLRDGDPGLPEVLFSLRGGRGALSLRIRLQYCVNLFHNFSRQEPVGRLARVNWVPPPQRARTRSISRTWPSSSGAMPMPN
jgi:hypothetical protein